MKILIVDDSPTMRRILANCVRELGDVEVIQAGDGQEALERLYEAGGVDLLLTDWRMPRMNGLELIRQVARSEAHRDTPIIVVTVEAEKQKVVQAFRAGARAYVVKPFEPEVLLEKIDQVFRGPRPQG